MRPTPDDVSPSSNGEDDKAWFRERFGDADIWVIAPGPVARRWTDFRHDGIAAIDYDGFGDLSEYASREAVHEAAVENGLGENPLHHSLALWNFAHVMRTGDVLIAKRGRRAVLGWGTVQGGYVYDLGRGFQLGHSFFVPDDRAENVDEGWYQSVVETQIAPLLREYWFDRPERAEELAELLRQ